MRRLRNTHIPIAIMTGITIAIVAIGVSTMRGIVSAGFPRQDQKEIRQSLRSLVASAA